MTVNSYRTGPDAEGRSGMYGGGCENPVAAACRIVDDMAQA